MQFLKSLFYIFVLLSSASVFASDTWDEGCAEPMKIFTKFANQEFAGKTLKSSPDWEQFISWKDHEMGGDSWKIVERSAGFDSCKKQGEIYVIISSSDIWGKSSYTGPGSKFLTYEIFDNSKKESRTFTMAKENGEWKIKSFTSENISWVGTRAAQLQFESLNSAQCKAAKEKAECEKIKTNTLASLDKLRTKLYQTGGKYSVAGIEDEKKFDKFFLDFKAKIAAGDKAGVSSLFNFPMLFNIDGKSKKITTKADFENQFAGLFDKNMTQAIADTSVEDLWARDQGATTPGGDLWFTEENGHYAIKAINHSRKH